MNFLVGVFSTGRILNGDGKFQGVNFFKGNFTLGNFPGFLNDILHMMLRVITQGKFSSGLNFQEDLSVGRRYFSVEVGPDFRTLFKNNKILNKNVFSTESKEQHYNLKRT